MAFPSFELSQVTSPSMQQAASSTRSEIRRIARCRVLAELGQGGMANVYLAVQHGQGGVDKLVVLKALRKEFEAESEALTMFLYEAVLGLVAAASVAAFTALGRSVREYLSESQFELRKVVWPTREVALRTTAVILVVVVILSLLLGLIDFFLKWIVLDTLLKFGG